MTISSQNRQAGPYNGNDITTNFAFAFKVFGASDLQVIKTDSAGVESTLTLSTHYTVSLNADQDANPGGTVTMLTAPATGTKLTLTSVVTPLQSTDLTNQGGFYPKVITNALDKLTILLQQLFNASNRSIKFPISDNRDGTIHGARNGKLLGFDAVGDMSLYEVQTGTSLVDLASPNGASLVGFNGYTVANSVAQVVNDISTLRTIAPRNGGVIDVKYHTSAEALLPAVAELNRCPMTPAALAPFIRILPHILALRE